MTTEREQLEQAIEALEKQRATLGERAHLEKAEAIFAEIGAEWDLARARELLLKQSRV